MVNSYMTGLKVWNKWVFLVKEHWSFYCYFAIQIEIENVISYCLLAIHYMNWQNIFLQTSLSYFFLVKVFDSNYYKNSDTPTHLILCSWRQTVELTDSSIALLSHGCKARSRLNISVVSKNVHRCSVCQTHWQKHYNCTPAYLLI